MNPQDVAPLVASHAVNSLVLGMVISILAWSVLRVIARHNSAARFAVLYSALLAMLALFFLRDPASGGTSSSPQHLVTFVISAKWAVCLLVAWALVAAAGVIRIAVGVWRLRALRQSFAPVNLSSLDSIFAQRARLSKRTVGLFHSPRVRVPAAIGFFRPAVVLPSWSLQEFSLEELKVTVLHELAHVDRWDDWTNLAQKLIRALLFFHPAVWWLDSILATERELSCDDVVLAQTACPDQYAQCLVSLAEKSFIRRPMSLVQTAVGRVKQTALRVSRILDRQERKVTSAWRPALAALAAFSAFGLLGIQHVPQLVVFQTGRSNAIRLPRMAQTRPPLRVIVPAAMRTPAASIAAPREISLMPPAAHAIPKRRATRNSSGALMARDSGQHRPVVNATANQRGSEEFMYVVMETRAYDSVGRVRITTSVWRLRFTTLGPVRTDSTAPPHST